MNNSRKGELMQYNPYENIEDFKKPEEAEGTKGEEESYNPYMGIESYPVVVPPKRMDLPREKREWRPREEMTPGERKEFDYAAKHPNLYALLQTSLGVAKHLPIVSYLKYMSAEERHDFSSLTTQQQTNALLHMSLDNALWAAFGAPSKGSFLLKMGVPERSAVSGVLEGAKGLAKYSGKLTTEVLKPLVRGMGKGREEVRIGGRAIVPLLRVEDSLKKLAILAPKVDFKGFEFKPFTRGILKREGFQKKEIELLVDPLVRGNGIFSVFDRATMAEMTRQNYKFSKAFQKAVPLVGDGSSERFMSSIWSTMHSEPIMEAAFKKRTFEKALETFYGGKELRGFHEDFSLRIFQRGANKLYPQMGKNFNFGEANLEQMANITTHMLEHPILGMKAIMPGKGTFTVPSMLPKRVVYGMGEAIHGTKTKVYEVMKGAIGSRNRDYFNNMLLWAQLLKQEGLYTKLAVHVTGEFTAKKAKFFTPEVSEKVYKLLVKMDNLTKAAERATSSGAKRELLEQARALPEQLFAKNDPGMLLYNAYKVYSDHLYSDFIKGHFSRTLGKLKRNNLLPEELLEALGKQNKNLSYEMDNLFSTVNQATHGWKMGSTKRLLSQAQRTIMRGTEGLDKEGLKQRKAIASLFGYGDKEGFPAYLENYVSRLRAKQLNLASSWQKSLSTSRKAAFRHPRKKTFGEEGDLATVLESRTMAQASELYLYDSLGDVVQYAKRLPPAFRDFIEADIAGTLGLPSVLDHKVAWFLTKSVGGIERFFGKSGIWDEWRVIGLGHTINTLTYMGALGFKPFSAIRNLFQVAMNVPADLGGIKDLGTLTSGIKRVLDPKVRQKIIRMGGITEFAPEIHLRPSALPFGKKKLFGKTLPSLQKTQDVALWMFKATDRYNRYMTGGAALVKWEKALNSVGGKVHLKNIEKFAKELNLSGRRDYIQDDIIRNLLSPKQSLAEAEKSFVLDVIADTQYLYGVSEAPLIIRKYGALGKTGFIFQSWFMNYGALLEKWITLGEPPMAKVNRMFTAMASAAIAYTLMETMWGSSTAMRTVALGPFPKELNEFMIPPAWKPIYHALAAISNCHDVDISTRHAKSILSSGAIMVPGFLQMKASYRGISEGGFEGFSRSILRLKDPEEAQGF